MSWLANHSDECRCEGSYLALALERDAAERPFFSSRYLGAHFFARRKRWATILRRIGTEFEPI